jgi:autotransporter-associated beta strand protein
LSKTAGTVAFGGSSLGINGGTLSHSADNQLGSDTIVTLSSGTWNLNGHTEAIGGFTFNGGSLQNLANGLSVGGGMAASVSLSGSIDLGNASDNPSGAILKLVNANTGIMVATGAPMISAAVNLGGLDRTITVSSGATLTISGALQNGSALSKASSGTLILTGSNDYSGSTTISRGILRVQGGEAIPDSSGVVLGTNTGTTFDLNSASETIGSLSGGSSSRGNTTLGSGTLTVGGDNSNATYAGVISGVSGNLTKIGTGIQTLSASNTYTGLTTISGGTLKLTGSINSSSGIAIAGGATLDVSSVSGYSLAQDLSAKGSGTANIGGTVNAAGHTLDLQDGAALNTLALSGGLALNNSTAKLDLSSAGSDQIAIAGAATLAGMNTINVAPLSSSTALITGTHAYTLITAASGLGNSFALSNSSATVGGTTYTFSLSGDASHEYLNVTAPNTVPTQTFSYGAPTNPTNAHANATVALSGTLSNSGGGNLLVSLSSTGMLNVDGLSSSSSPIVNGMPAIITGTIHTGSQSGGQNWQITNDDPNATNNPITISGVVNVYNLAAAAESQTVDIGALRAGTAKSAPVLITNTAPVDAIYSETLATAGFNSTASGFTAAGAVTGIGGGSSDGGTLAVGLGPTLAAGHQSGNTTLSLNSTEVNGSGLGITAIGAQAITITGDVYDYAQANGSAGTLALGNVRVGAAAPSANLALSNTTISNAAYQDNLTAAANTDNPKVTALGFTELTAGNSNELVFTGNTSTAGSLASTVTLTISSTNSRSGLDAKTLSPDGPVATTGGVYDYAQPTHSGTLAIGNIRTGQSVEYSILNSTISNADFQDSLEVVADNGGNANLAASNPTNILSGKNGNIIYTAIAAGTLAANSSLAFVSNANGISGLSNQSLAPGVVMVTGAAYDFADPVIANSALTFGLVHVGAIAQLAIGNSTINQAEFQDLLDVSGTPTGGNLLVTGFTGLAASPGGATTQDVIITAADSMTGSLADTVTLNLTSNANGVPGLSNQALGQVSIQVTGSVFNGTGRWIGSTDGNWGNNDNWSDANGIHAAPGTFGPDFDNVDIAAFAGAGAGATISLDVQPSLKAINFSGSAGYSIIPGAAAAITLKSNAGSATISATAGSDTIAAVVALASNAEITTSANANLHIPGGIDNSSGKNLLLSQSDASLLTIGNILNNGVVTTAGAMSVGAITGSGSTIVSANSTLSTTQLRQQSLAIQGDDLHSTATVTVAASGSNLSGDSAQVSILGSKSIALTPGSNWLEIAGGADQYFGSLDLNNNDLIVVNANPGDAAATFSSLSGLLKAGLAGNGLKSSSSDSITGLGLITDSAQTFDGTDVDANASLVKFTFFGDLNLDGIVDSNEIATVVNSFNEKVRNGGWASGDANYDGVVDGNDIAAIVNAYNGQNNHFSPLPEPSTVVLTGCAAVALMLFKTRKRGQSNG